MPADLGLIQNWLGQQFMNPQGGSQLTSNASTQINNQTRGAITNLLSKFSTTGMGRSGISGAATNGIYSGAGEQLTNASAQGAQLDQNTKMQSLGEMGQIAQYQDQKPGFMNFLGSLFGQAGGTATGFGLAKLLGFGGGK